MDRDPKTERITIRVTPKRKAQLEMLAGVAGRSLSNFIERQIEESLKNRAANGKGRK